MRILYLIILLSIFLSCASKKEDSKILPKEKNEILHLSYNLPQLIKWKELHANKNVKERFGEYVSKNSKMVGLYLSNKTAIMVDSLEHLDIDDYAVFYTVNKDQQWKVQNIHLKSMFDETNKKINISTVNKKELIDRVFRDTTFLKTDRLYLLKKYQKYDNIYTGVYITKPYDDDHQFIVITIINMMSIKNRLVYGGYYLNFTDEKSIDLAIKNNNYIMNGFVKANR